MKKPTKNDVRGTLDERHVSHGEYTNDAGAAIAILDTFDDFGAANLDPVKRHALYMIAFKIARIVSGNPDHKDHWHDIAGYATLAEDRCETDTQG